MSMVSSDVDSAGVRYRKSAHMRGSALQACVTSAFKHALHVRSFVRGCLMGSARYRGLPTVGGVEGEA